MQEDPVTPDVPRVDALPPTLALAAEEICPHCGGSGERDGARCHGCDGTGWAIRPLGSA